MGVALVAARKGPLAIAAALLGWPIFGSSASRITGLVMNAVSAASAPSLPSVRGLGRLWPPTKQNRGYVATLIVAALVAIFVAMRSPDTHVKQTMMDKKRRKAEEALEKLLEDAANAKPPSPQAEQAANAITDMADSVRAFPAQYQEVFEQSLREQDGIKQIVAILLEYHQDPQDAQQRGATLVGAAPELVDEVQRLLVRGNLESRLRKHFPSVGAEASAEDEDGSDDKPSTDASSPEAREAADKIKEFYLAFKTWPTQFQQLLKGMLNDDAKTWEQKVQDMVKHHAAPSSGHPADVRVLSGASEKLQAEIIEVLVASDFEDKLMGLLKGTKGPNAERCFGCVVDENEMSSVTMFGILETDIIYIQGVDLLKETVNRELQETVAKTIFAREHKDELIDADGSKSYVVEGEDVIAEELRKFENGTELNDLLKLVVNVEKYFGKTTVDPARKKSAKELSAKIATEGQQKFWRLLKLAIPMLPTYSVSLVFKAIKDGVLEVQLQLMFAEIADLALQPNGQHLIRAAASKVLVFFAYRELMGIFGGVMANKSNSGFLLVLRRTVYAHMLRQDIAYFDKKQASVLQEQLNSDTRQIAQVIFDVPQSIVTNCFYLFWTFRTLWQDSKEMTIVGLASLPIITLANYFMIQFYIRNARRQRNQREISVASTTETLQEIRTVRELVMEPEENEAYRQMAVYQNSLIDQSRYAQVWVGAAIGTIFISNQLILMFMGSKMVHAGTMQPARLSAVAFLANTSCFRCIGMINQITSSIEVVIPAARICDLMDTKSKIEPDPESPEPKLTPPQFQGRIEFRNVGFSYPTAKDTRVLKGLSFTVEPGQKVAVVGPAGCGKSSCMRMLERFYAPDSGQILVDGHPIQDYDVHHWRRNLAIVSQENVLFDKTIKENILYGAPEDVIKDPVSGQFRSVEDVDAQVIQVLKDANAWEFVQKLEYTIDQPVGARGGKLSGGQKQRINIARAMLRRPTVLLLDEATSALDSKNEKIVQAALDSMLWKTGIGVKSAGCAVVIAHKLTTVRNCDKIVVVKDGLKVEEGTHDELVKIEIKTKGGTGEDKDDTVQGVYADLWKTQMRSNVAQK